jgi:hypothetical protein
VTDVRERVIDVVLPRDAAPVVLAVLDRGRCKRGREFEDGMGWEQIAADGNGGLLAALLVRLRWGVGAKVLEDVGHGFALELNHENAKERKHEKDKRQSHGLTRMNTDGKERINSTSDFVFSLFRVFVLNSAFHPCLVRVPSVADCPS